MLTKIGNWLFHLRNILFPVFYAALFIPSPCIFQNTGWTLITGSTIILAGILVRCATIGLVYIIRGGVNRKIYAENLVTDGIYRVCRNPMYLGNIVLILGFGLFANSLLFVSIFFPLFVFFYAAIIRAEEDFLSKKFGQQYIDYKSNTNAIIPKLKNMGIAFQGHKFKWEKVIFNEYNSLFIYFSGICLILYHHDLIETSLAVVIEAIFLIIYLTVKVVKKYTLRA